MAESHPSEDDQNGVDDTENDMSLPAKSSSNFKKGRTTLNENLPPISNIEDIFADLTENAIGKGLSKVLDHLGSRPLRVATMCSGTESPLLALSLIRDCLKTIDKNLNIKHLFSAEIDVFKQAYIERNFAPDIMFRDVLEIGQSSYGTTAYGARVPVPEDNIDLLVAGPSCVDFSALNTKKRGWEDEDRGESADTCRAVICFVARSKPSLIIIENVAGAPWKKIEEEFEGAGYSAKYVKLDTKDFYIPHTRQRGYLICVAKSKTRDAKGCVDEAILHLETFKRPASVPFEAFLLSEDDPRVHRARKDFIKDENGDDKEPTDTDWIVCQGRYAHYRHQLKLGILRPMTYWQPGGSCSVPDYVWRDWARVQGERILDTLDIASLRKAVEGIDTQYKTRIWDLSQNVDRFTDTAPSGIASCITPKGAFYVTTRGGPLLGIEALALQGLPIDQLLLTRESNSNLHDLAGNAMTSTVVGAAMLSALLAGYTALNTGKNHQPVDHLSDKAIPIISETELFHQPLDLNGQSSVSTTDILTVATYSARLCNCEGGTSILKGRFKRCIQCFHTSCFRCAVNPPHDYTVIPEEETRERILPADFKRSLKSALPMVIQLSGLSARTIQHIKISQKSKLEDEVWKTYVSQVIKAVNQPLRFISIQRSRRWTVRYHSPYGRAELVLGKAYAYWKFYAVSPHYLPTNDILRKLLAQPFARMRPAAQSLLRGSWQFGLWIMLSAELQLNSSTETSPSWEMRLGLQGDQFSTKRVSQKLEICLPSKQAHELQEDISGTYSLLPNCGTACSSLYRRLDLTKAPLFLFLDPDRTGRTQDDCFVFSRTAESMSYGQTRDIIARLDPSWCLPQSAEIAGVDYMVESLWIDLGSLNFTRPISELSAYISSPTQHFQLTTSSQSCNTRIVILHFQVDSLLLPDVAKSLGWTNIKSTNQMRFLTDESWLFQSIPEISILGLWQDTWHVPNESCSHCAPPLPKVIWIKDLNTGSVTVMEEPQSAARYERVLKGRPPPFQVQTRKDEHSQTHVRLSINALALAHRAQANLLTQSSGAVTLACRLVAEDNETTFKRSPFSLRNNRGDPPADQPPNFKFPLRSEQLRSLSWMIKRENAIEPFLVEEVEEAVIPQIGWRLEGRATQTTYCRGGLLADEVGYGKTATTLALIDSQSPFNDQNTDMKGKIVVKGTLIIAPYHLLSQWKSEIGKFLGNTYKVESISNLAGLSRMTIGTIADADIILTTWNLLENQAYLNRLLALTNSRDKPKGARALLTWYEETLRLLDASVETLKSSGPGELASSLLKGRHGASTVGFVDYAPLRRFKGKEYEENSTKIKAQYQKARESNVGEKRKGYNELAKDHNEEASGKWRAVRAVEIGEFVRAFALGAANTMTEVKSPLFQMFHFNRIVLDEYSYLAGEERVYVLSLSARSKFALSGTPPLGDFAEVKKIATFLGSNIGVDNITPGTIKASSIKAIQREYTKSEELRSYAESYSAAWHQRRHDVAQRFLALCVRQNVPEIDEIPLKEHYIAVRLPSLERAYYLELQQQAVVQTLKLRSKTKDDYYKILNERIIAESESIPEALLKGCSYFPWSESTPVGSTIQHPCDLIVSKRRADLSDIDEQLQQLIANAIELRGQCTLKLNGATHHSIELHDQLYQEIQRNIPGDLQSSIAIADMYGKVTEIQCNQEPVDLQDKSEESRPAKIQKLSKFKVQRKATSKSAEAEITTRSTQETTATLRERVVDIRRMIRNRVGCQRSLRLIENVFRIQKLDLGGQTIYCSSPSCTSGNLQRSQVSIIGICGHLICNNCVKDLTRNAPCVAEDCPIDISPSRLYSGHFLGRFDDRLYRAGYQGQKFEELIRLINSIPYDEQALLFIQFANLAEKVQAALIAAGIKVAFLKKGAHLSILTKFQGEARDSLQTKVLMCCIDDESASGSNLARCNHVIFYSTLLAPSLDQYKATMKQAIGRARRYGQQRTVNVYHMVTLRSIDVDVLQHRNKGKIFIQSNTGYQLVDRGSIPEGCSKQGFGSGLAHRFFSGLEDEEELKGPGGTGEDAD